MYVGEDLCQRDGHVAVLEPRLADAEHGLSVASAGVNAVGDAIILRLTEKTVATC